MSKCNEKNEENRLHQLMNSQPPASHLRSQSLNCPRPTPPISDPVVKPSGLPLPELNHLRIKPKTAPKLRPWHWPALDFRAKLVHFSHQEIPAFHDFALR